MTVFFSHDKYHFVQVFPPCNSEWKKDTGGRVWCSTKSGGVTRDWVGVPRIYTDPTARGSRCACVKNFGPGLSAQAAQGANRYYNFSLLLILFHNLQRRPGSSLP